MPIREYAARNTRENNMGAKIIDFPAPKLSDKDKRLLEALERVNKRFAELKEIIEKDSINNILYSLFSLRNTVYTIDNIDNVYENIYNVDKKILEQQFYIFLKILSHGLKYHHPENMTYDILIINPHIYYMLIIDS